MRSARQPALILVLAVLGGCGSSVPRAEDPAENISPSPSPTSSEPAPSEPPSGPAADAVADLVGRLDVDRSDVEVVGEEEVTWRDGSLGCAEPDGFYTQALVEGARITLRVGTTDYHYHSGGSREPFLCEEPTQ